MVGIANIKDRFAGIAPGLAAGAALVPGGEGRVRLRTLVLIRWIAVAGQALAVLFVRFGLEFELPLLPVVLAIAASALLNIVVSLRYPAATRLGDLGAALYFGYDLVQLAVLLYLTGGLNNPFCLLILVPVTISATNLTLRSTISLGILAVACVSLLAVLHRPLPWSGDGLTLPMVYLFGIWAALVLGMAFICIYAWRVAEETRRMSAALAEAQAALAREQRLSALDGLAAAAAHALGTPLGTITLVVRELARDLPPDSPLAEEVALLDSEAERCREILASMSRDPQEDDSAFAATTLRGLVEAAAGPYLLDDAVQVKIAAADAADRAAEPRVPRSPEVLHGLGNLIENAVDFARHEVRIELDWDDREIRVTIADDGPGMPSDILGALGDPYVTTRNGEGGMGLGIFIAKTLLERTGARVAFANRQAAAGQTAGAVTGATVAIVWPRGVLET